MTTEPSLRDRALDAAKQALNRSGYWLPADGQAAAVDAIAAVYETARVADLRATIMFVERIGAARIWACENLDADQQAELLGVLRGDQPKETPDA